MVSTSFKAFLSSATAATLLARVAMAQGSISACNYTPSTVYYELIGQYSDYGNNQIWPNTCVYVEYGQQISMKMDYDGSFSAPYQFEFNLDLDEWTIWYDFSAINGNPFQNVPRAIYPSDNTCATFYCDAYDSGNDCQYTSPYDFGAAGCSGDASLTMNIG